VKIGKDFFTIRRVSSDTYLLRKLYVKYVDSMGNQSAQDEEEKLPFPSRINQPEQPM
jgi:hypothetical protein